MKRINRSFRPTLEVLEGRVLMAGNLSFPSPLFPVTQPEAVVRTLADVMGNFLPGGTYRVATGTISSPIGWFQPKEIDCVAGNGELLSQDIRNVVIKADLKVGVPGCETVVGTGQINPQTEVLVCQINRPFWAHGPVRFEVDAQMSDYPLDDTIALNFAQVSGIDLGGNLVPDTRMSYQGDPIVHNVANSTCSIFTGQMPATVTAMVGDQSVAMSFFVSASADVAPKTITVTASQGNLSTNAKNYRLVYSSFTDNVQHIVNGTVANGKLSFVLPSGFNYANCQIVDILTSVGKLQLQVSGMTAVNTQTNQPLQVFRKNGDKPGQLNYWGGEATVVNIVPQAVAASVKINSAYVSQSVTPNTTGVKLGSFIVSNPSTSGSANVTSLVVKLAYGAGTSSLNLSALRTSETSGSGAVPVQPTTSPAATSATNTFPVNFTLAPGTTKTIDIFANSGSDVGATATVTTSLSIVSSWATGGVGSDIVSGQTITFANGHLNTPTLVASATSVSQYVTGGTNEATRATNNFVATGPGIITQLQFSVVSTSPGAVTAIRVGSVVAPVINNVALLTGLSLSVPAGGVGLNVTDLVSYAPVGINGIPSGTKVAVGVSSVTFVSGGRTEVSAFASAIMAPAVTLVASKPAISLSLPNGASGSSMAGLTVGMNSLARVTVSADASGDINQNVLTLVLSPDAPGTRLSPADGLSVGVSFPGFISSTEDGHGNLILTLNFTGGYRVPAGQSVTFDLRVMVASLSGTHASISTKLGSPDLFGWTDVAGNGIAGAGLGTLIYGFPTKSVVVHN